MDLSADRYIKFIKLMCISKNIKSECEHRKEDTWKQIMMKFMHKKGKRIHIDMLHFENTL